MVRMRMRRTQLTHPKKVFTDDELTNIVDLVLKEDDLNWDGYIEYAEFVTAQRRARQTEDKENKDKSNP